MTIAVEGTSPTSARSVYNAALGGVPIRWTIDFYAATPNVGAVITQVTVRGINVTTQLTKNLSPYGGQSISAIPSGFVVDPVSSCRCRRRQDDGHRGPPINLSSIGMAAGFARPRLCPTGLPNVVPSDYSENPNRMPAWKQRLRQGRTRR